MYRLSPMITVNTCTADGMAGERGVLPGVAAPGPEMYEAPLG